MALIDLGGALCNNTTCITATFQSSFKARTITGSEQNMNVVPLCQPRKRSLQLNAAVILQASYCSQQLQDSTRFGLLWTLTRSAVGCKSQSAEHDRASLSYKTMTPYSRTCQISNCVWVVHSPPATNGDHNCDLTQNSILSIQSAIYVLPDVVLCTCINVKTCSYTSIAL